MKKKLFEELLEGVKQGCEYLRGKRKPSRVLKVYSVGNESKTLVKLGNASFYIFKEKGSIQIELCNGLTSIIDRNVTKAQLEQLYVHLGIILKKK